MRRLLRWAVRSGMALVFIGGLLFLNIAMLSSAAIYDALWGGLRNVVSSVSNTPWTQRSTFAELDQDIKKLNADLDLTRTEIDTKTKRLSQLDADLRAEKKTSQTVATKLAGVLEDRKIITAELNDNLKQLDRTERRLAAQEVDFDRATRELVSSRAVQADQLDKLILSRQSMSQLRTKLDVTRGDLSDARRLLSTPPSAVSDDALKAAQRITKQMKSRTVSTIRRNTAGNLSELIPVLGTVTSVGLIAWDLYDTCQQLQSIQQLEKALTGQDSEAGIAAENCGMSRQQLIAEIMGTDLQMAACVEARLRTRLIDPPECKGYESGQPTYEDPPDLELPDISLPNY